MLWMYICPESMSVVMPMKQLYNLSWLMKLTFTFTQNNTLYLYVPHVFTFYQRRNVRVCLCICLFHLLKTNFQLDLIWFVHAVRCHQICGTQRFCFEKEMISRQHEIMQPQSYISWKRKCLMITCDSNKMNGVERWRRNNWQQQCHQIAATTSMQTTILQ